MRATLMCLLAVVMLSACGASAEHHSTPRPAHHSTPKSAVVSSGAPEFDDAQAVADAAGLTQCTPSASGNPDVDEVSCENAVIVVHFADASETPQFVHNELGSTVAKNPDMGILYGDVWGIGCMQRSVCAALQSNLGGTLKP